MPGRVTPGSGGTIGLESADVAAGILHVAGDEMPADVADGFERFCGFRDDRGPVLRFGFCEVDGDEFLLGCIEVGLDKKGRAVVSDQAVGGIEFGEEFDELTALLFEIPIEEAVLGVGSLADVHHEVAAIVSEEGVEPPERMIGTFISEFVGCLRSAN